MKDLLFLCIANSARSQMAEGIARRLAGDGIGVHSAGSRPGSVHPLAVEVMHEIEIDISHHSSKGLADIPVKQIDTAITLCAEEECPVLPEEVTRIHWPLADPATASGEDWEMREAFRLVRDELLNLIQNLLKTSRS